jgi:Domain of unknown function (DUF4389)
MTVTAPARFCTACGRERIPGARFCTGCGREFADAGALAMPLADLPVADEQGPSQPYPVVYRADYQAAQHRVATIFRLVLAVPHIIMWALILVPSLALAVLGWSAALVIGRLPGPIRRFQVATLTYVTRVTGYLVLLTDRWPPFPWQEPRRPYPVRITVAPAAPLPRLRTLVVLPLALPAILTAILFGVVACMLAIGAWLAIIFTGRLPRTIYDMQQLAIGFQSRTLGHFPLLLTHVYPWYESGPLILPSRR